MKKIIVFMLVVFMVFGVCGCTSNSIDDNLSMLASNITSKPDVENSSDLSSQSEISSVETSSQQSPSATSSNPSPSNVATSAVSSKPSTPVVPTKTTITVTNVILDEVYGANAGLVCGKKDGKYGVVKTDGTVVVSFDHDWIYTPTPEGYTVAGKGTKNMVYNSNGQIVFSADVTTIGKTVNDHQKFFIDGEEILSAANGVILTKSNIRDVMFPYDYTMTLRNMNGVVIKTFEHVVGCSGFSGGQMAVGVSDNDTGTYTYIINTKGEIVKKYDNKISVMFFGGNNAAKGLSGGSFISRWPNTDDTHWDKSLDYSKINEYSVGSNEPWEYIDNYGSLVVYKNNNKYFIVNVDKIFRPSGGNTLAPPYYDPGIVTEHDYTYITFCSEYGNSVKYAFVERDGKQGFLSFDIKTEKLYTYAGGFYGGKAIVNDNGNIFIVDESFKQSSNIITVKGDSGYNIVTYN